MRLDQATLARGVRRLRWWAGWAESALILVYHRIAEPSRDPFKLCVTPRHFAEQLEVLSRSHLVVRLDELVTRLAEGRLPRRACVVTFDDGYADNLHTAKPLLERYDVPATVFVVTGAIGEQREFWWDELDQIVFEPKTLPRKLWLDIGRWWPSRELSAGSGMQMRRRLYGHLWQRLWLVPEDKRRDLLGALGRSAGLTPRVRSSHRQLSAAEVGMLASSHLIELGAHTVSHATMSGLSKASQRHEITASKRSLEELAGKPVASFSYPHGRYGPDSPQLLREAGLACACAGDADVVRTASDRFTLPRIHVRDWNGDRFAHRLATAFLWG